MRGAMRHCVSVEKREFLGCTCGLSSVALEKKNSPKLAERRAQKARKTGVLNAQCHCSIFPLTGRQRVWLVLPKMAAIWRGFSSWYFNKLTTRLQRTGAFSAESAHGATLRTMRCVGTVSGCNDRYTASRASLRPCQTQPHSSACSLRFLGAVRCRARSVR